MSFTTKDYPTVTRCICMAVNHRYHQVMSRHPCHLSSNLAMQWMHLSQVFKVQNEASREQKSQLNCLRFIKSIYKSTVP